MRTFFTLIGLAGATFAAVAPACPAFGQRPATRRAATQKKPDPFEAVRALRVELPDVTLDGLPLDEFVEWLARETKVNVVARWKVLQRAGVERDAPVSVKLKNVLLREVLRTVLEKAGDAKQPLAFRASGNIITISTKADLDRTLVTRTYEVRDLLVLSPRFEVIDLGPNRLSQGTKVLAGDGLQEADASVQQLVRVITTTVYPDSWKVNGGSGTIAFFRGHLVIRNTPEVHETLAGGGFRATTREEP